jgi:hypothetical protein
MSFSIEEEKNNLPFVLVKGGKADGEIIYVCNEDQNVGKKSVVKKEPIRFIECEDGQFYQIPNSKVRCLLIAGPAGSGKSSYTRDYASMYKKLYPESTIYLFSRIQDDPSLVGLDYRRVFLSEELVQNPLQIEEVKDNSMIIFDDCDCLPTKKLTDSIYQFQMQLLELGRHMNIQVVITSHLIIGAKSQSQARTILNEMGSLTVFPGSGSASQISYALTKYYGMTKKQITQIMALKSRWVTIVKVYPQFVISAHECVFVSEL